MRLRCRVPRSRRLDDHEYHLSMVCHRSLLQAGVASDFMVGGPEARGQVIGQWLKSSRRDAERLWGWGEQVHEQ